MKECKTCHLKFNTVRKTCPFCFKDLDTIDGKELSMPLYPHREKRKGKNNLFYKIVIFICLTSVFITFLINLLTKGEDGKWWFLYVLLSCFYFFMVVRTAILTRSYAIKRLFIQLLVTSLILYGIDVLSGDIRWSVGYVIPCVCMLTNITIGIMNIAMKDKFGEDFNSTMLGLLFGFVPFVFQLCGWVNVKSLWAPLVSMCTSIIIFMGMIIFAGKYLKEELSKRLHI